MIFITEMAKPGDWNNIQRKGKKEFLGDKWDIFKNGVNCDGWEITSFFFTDFDRRWRAKDMFFEFKGLGNMDEIFIPPKD